MFVSIPKGMLYAQAKGECTLDQEEVRKLFEDEFGYGLRSYERATGIDWKKLKQENENTDPLPTPK